MVVFACNSCGATLKKNQVDKHVFQCRCSTVSCMDCQKDFGLKDYGGHTKCVSEAEKYGGNDWKAPSNFNKGEKKQQAWVDTVNDTLKKAGSSLSPPCRSLLQTLSKHDNVPRKKAKFMNFLKNIARNRFDQRTIENVWNLLEEQWRNQGDALKKGAAAAKIEEEKGIETEKMEEGGVEEKEKVAENVEGDSAKKLSKREKKAKKQYKEEKKEKKKKLQDEENCQDAVNGSEEVSASATEKLSKKEKKKRKPKKDEENCEDEVNGSEESGATTAIEKLSKKKKKKKLPDAENREGEVNGGEELGAAATEKLSKKKKRKRLASEAETLNKRAKEAV